MWESVGGDGRGDLRSSRVAQDWGRGGGDWRGDLGDIGRWRALAVADDERGSFLISVQIAESGRHAAGSNNGLDWTGLKVLTSVSVSVSGLGLVSVCDELLLLLLLVTVV